MRAALDAALDIDHAIESAGSPDKKRFMDLAREQGLKAALAWREARFRAELLGALARLVLPSCFEPRMEPDVLLGELVLRLEINEQHRALMRFAYLDRGGEVGLEHRQALGKQFLHHLLRQSRTAEKLVHDDSLDHEPGIVIGADLGDVVEQAVERTARERVAVERDEAAVGCDERRAGEEVERRRRVDVDEIVFFVELGERLAQLEIL